MPRRIQMPKQQTVKNEEKSLCSKIKAMVDDSISLTAEWEHNQIKWHKMRMRIKKEKTFPFVGCANLRMPTIETKMRKLKSAIINTIFGIRPIIQAVPCPSGNWETARKIEKFLDHLIVDVMKYKQKAIITVDQTFEKGFFVNKPYWKVDIIGRQTELKVDELSEEEQMFLVNPNVNVNMVYQAIIKKYDVDMSDLVAKENMQSVKDIVEALMSGKKKIDVRFLDVICNYPDVSLCEPERVYVSTDSGFHPQSCSYIIHEFLLPFDSIKANGESKGWDISNISDIKDKSERAKDKEIDTEKEIREGISVLERTGKVKIWEFYGYMDIHGKGKKEKCVVTLAPDFDKELRKIVLDTPSGDYPFVKFFYELTDDRWFSHRGIPELIEDIVKEIDIQHCQKIDQQTMRNAPQYVFRAGMINPNATQFLFGQGYPVQGMQPLNDLIQPLNNNNQAVEFSYEREQMLLESKVEELIGQIDFTLHSMINKRQPRTLGEVQLQFQSQQQVFSMDAELFRISFEELFNKIWELWCQYGSDSYEFAYFGKDGFDPIKLTKEELQGKYKITIRGNDQNTNPQLRIQKAQMIMAGMQNPIALQSGVITPINLANAYKRFYQELDIPAWEELVSMPQPPQPPPPQMKIGMSDLTDAEQAQVLAKHGIQPDSQGRALKSQAKIQEKEHEQENETLKTYSDVMSKLEEPDAEEETES